MLVQFSVENFLSFPPNRPVTLSMRALPDGKHSSHVHPSSIVPPGLGKFCVIYGANASGKSNLIKALSYLKKKVTDGVPMDSALNPSFFRLGNGEKHPSTFQIEFVVKEKLYSYGVSITRNKIVEEWLSARSVESEEQIHYFERTEQISAEATKGIVLLSGFSEEEKPRIRNIAQDTRAEQLFIWNLADRDVAIAQIIRSWFNKQLVIIEPEAILPDTALRLHRNDQLRTFYEKVLQNLGTGVGSLSIRRVAIPSEALAPEALEELRSGKQLLARRKGTGAVDMLTMDGEQPVKFDILFHPLTEQDFTLRIDEQSDGTRRLLDLIPILTSDAVFPSDTVVVVDEIERSLHPILCKSLISQYLAGTNLSVSQLICTTHDTNLLSVDLLRTDEVWFTEKDRVGSSHLYSLSEFKPEQIEILTENLEKGYLQGRFGAIPFLGNATQLGGGKECQ